MSFKKYKEKKDPDSDVDYGMVWGDQATDGKLSKGWLKDDETIATSQFIITSEDEDIPTLSIGNQGTSISDDEKSTNVWLTGGTAGVEYMLTNRISTSNPDNSVRREDATKIVVVDEK